MTLLEGLDLVVGHLKCPGSKIAVGLELVELSPQNQIRLLKDFVRVGSIGHQRQNEQMHPLLVTGDQLDELFCLFRSSHLR